MTAPEGARPGSHRHEVIAAQEQALLRERRREHEQATAMILRAVRRWREAGIEPLPLRARPFTGSGSIRTGLHGWYLKQDRSLAVDTEGRYYVMRVDGGLRARWRGAAPRPGPAPLVVGRGGRDGESFDLEELLELRTTDPVRP